MSRNNVNTSQRLSAIIIGINKYPAPSYTSHQLHGCVRDAHAISNFLTQKLKVPPDRIKVLENEAATRQAILSTFETHFSNSEFGDTFLFYFAGHGSRPSAPAHWKTTDGRIECICPYDSEEKLATGEIVPDIPDYTMGELVRLLAAKKGNNIIAILDCCHSGGAMRDGTQIRYFPHPFALPPDIDSEVWRVGAMRASNLLIDAEPGDLKYSRLSSYVLLAACGETEVAKEVKSPEGPCGAFTRALVRQLERRHDRGLLHRTTYSELIDSLQLSVAHQTPQCEGTYKNRICFGSDIEASSFKFFRLSDETTEGNVFRLEAGSIHGLVVGTELAVHVSNSVSPENPPLGILKALIVDSMDSDVVPREGDSHFNIPIPAYAIVSSYNNVDFALKVFYNYPVISQDEVMERVRRSGPLSQSIILVQLPEHADIVVEDDGKGEACINRCAPWMWTHVALNPSRSIKSDPDAISYAVVAVAHFIFYLSFQSPKNPMLEDKVMMELHRVEKGTDYSYHKVGQNLFKNQHACLPSDKNLPYGITVVNCSVHDLFPYLFHFDPTDYSITRYYTPESSGMVALLKQQTGGIPSTFPIGHESCREPITYWAADGTEVDEGFIKLYVSEHFMDLDFIQQDPIGEIVHIPQWPMLKKVGQISGERSEVDVQWEQWLYTVTIMV